MVKYYSRACIFLQDEISMHWNACEGFYPSPPMKPQQTTYFLFFFQVWIPHSVGLGQHLRTFRILAPNSPFSKLHIRAYFKYCRILRRIFGVSLAKHLPHGRARGRVHGASTPVGYSGEDLQVRRTDRQGTRDRLHGLLAGAVDLVVVHGETAVENTAVGSPVAVTDAAWNHADQTRIGPPGHPDHDRSGHRTLGNQNLGLWSRGRQSVVPITRKE